MGREACAYRRGAQGGRQINRGRGGLTLLAPNGAGTVYDIEIQTTNKKNLPRRVRYYQGLIDVNILEKGEDYKALRKSYVIFIATYDPFGKGRYVYTFENRCREDNSIALGDDAVKLVLNTKGTVGEINGELKALLRYMDGMEPDSEYTKDLNQAVTEVKADEEWRREFMVMNELIRSRERLAEHRRSVASVRQFRNEFKPEQLAKISFVSMEMLKVIQDAIDAHPDWDDEQIAENVEFE